MITAIWHVTCDDKDNVAVNNADKNVINDCNEDIHNANHDDDCDELTMLLIIKKNTSIRIIIT